MENFLQINKKIINESSKNNDKGYQNILLDSGPWPYIDKYYKFVSQKEGNDTLYFECQMCLPRKQVVACTKKSRNGLKSHCNRFHSLISSEFKKCLIDGTKTSRKRPYDQSDEEDIASTGCSKKKRSQCNRQYRKHFHLDLENSHSCL